MFKSLPPLYVLRAFERAVHLESFTLAAQELNITQSAVSKHIKVLENYFGCLLFIRKGHKLTVTNHGKILAKDLQSAFKLIENSCKSFEENRSVLRLKVPTSLMMSWLMDSGFKFEVQLSTTEKGQYAVAYGLSCKKDCI